MIDREQAIKAAQEAAATHCWMAPNDVLPFIVDAILALPDPVHEVAREALEQIRDRPMPTGNASCASEIERIQSIARTALDAALNGGER